MSCRISDVYLYHLWKRVLGRFQRCLVASLYNKDMLFFESQLFITDRSEAILLFSFAVYDLITVFVGLICCLTSTVLKPSDCGQLLPLALVLILPRKMPLYTDRLDRAMVFWTVTNNLINKQTERQLNLCIRIPRYNIYI